MAEEQDFDLLGDFLTEANELVEQLDADLVDLEGDGGSPELMNQIFRALHTIKGAASFLNLPAITSFAHVAEDTLNQLRKGDLAVSSDIVDMLLQSVDVLRGQLEELASGASVSSAPQELIDRFHAVSANPDASPATEVVTSKGTGESAPTDSGCSESLWIQARRPLQLSSEKADIVPLMREELVNAAEDIERCALDLEANKPGDEVSCVVMKVLSELKPTAEYFGIACIIELVEVTGHLGEVIRQSTPERADATADRLHTVSRLLNEVGTALGESTEIVLDSNGLRGALLDDVPVSSGAPDAEQLDSGATSGDQPRDLASSSPPEQMSAKKDEPRRDGPRGEQTVRVEVGRLEALMNLVGELVLTKNQILGICRQLRTAGLAHEAMESINGAVGDLDRLTAEMQMGVMRTRLQPLSKLFGRYPRVVRDLAKISNKQIGIEIVGGETEVDKGVLEQLADPMVHILRNSADHGVESPEKRVASGKPAQGTIRIVAEHQGGHVRVAICDDGHGIDPERVADKAVEKGVVSAEQAAQMSDSEKINLIFAPGLSMAAKVSDLSGRGVGMDVVRTNIAKLGGSVNVNSTVGIGTEIEVLIPLTVAIMPAMMVRVGPRKYAVPVANIIEIVRLQPGGVRTVAGGPVIRLREQVLPLILMRERLDEEPAGVDEDGDSCRFAVVVEVGQQRAGLVVDELIGQQEVVIKPLDDAYTSGGPFSGATILENGGISLILDVNQLVRSASRMERQAA